MTNVNQPHHDIEMPIVCLCAVGVQQEHEDNAACSIMATDANVIAMTYIRVLFGPSPLVCSGRKSTM